MLRFYQRTAPIVFRQQSRLFCVKFAKSHEWVDFTTGKVGITDHAQEALGEIVFCELPGVGDSFDAKEVFATVESVKAASDVYLPVSGKVVEVRQKKWLVKLCVFGMFFFFQTLSLQRIVE